MKITAEPRSDQWNADDFIGGPRTFTIAAVHTGKAEQKYDIELVGEKRAWRPPLTILRLLIEAWGDEAADWVGRRVMLYRDPSIKFGNDQVGGIRVSHMSDLPGNKTFTAMLTSTRGRRTKYTVEPLPDSPKPPTEAAIATCTDKALLREWWTNFPALQQAIGARVAEIDAADDRPDAGAQ